MSMFRMGYHIAAWRHAVVQADGSMDFHHFLNDTTAAERGKFDLVFIADEPVDLASRRNNHDLEWSVREVAEIGLLYAHENELDLGRIRDRCPPGRRRILLGYSRKNAIGSSSDKYSRSPGRSRSDTVRAPNITSSQSGELSGRQFTGSSKPAPRGVSTDTERALNSRDFSTAEPSNRTTTIRSYGVGRA